MYAKRRSTLKKLITVLSMILVMLIGVAGTLSYLQVATQPVQNTFAPSNIDLTLEETTTTYKMIPGVEIKKDPKVTVKADIDCYVFVKVEESANFDTYMTYAIANGWIQLKDANDNNIAGVYYREVSATTDEDGDNNNHVEAFTVLADNKVTVPDTVDKDDMNALYDTDGTVKADSQPKLTFTAYAIQKAGFETDLVGAWAAAQGLQG